MLCYTHGDASTLHDAEGDLASIRVGELALAGQMPGADPVRLLVDGYRDLRALAESRIGAVRELAPAFFGDVDGAEPVTITEPVARDDRGDVVVADVRPRLEFEAGHLPGAVNIPLDELSDRLGELDPDTPVVAYCRGPYCLLSAQAVAQLRDSGRQARRLDAGPIDWHAAGLPLAAGA